MSDWDRTLLYNPADHEPEPQEGLTEPDPDVDPYEGMEEDE